MIEIQSEIITHPNGTFGYTLPERKLGNYELQEFFKLIGIPIKKCGWHTRQDRSNPSLKRPDWCWQNYFVTFGYGVDSGTNVYNRIVDYFELHPSKVYVSCSYGRSSMQFTLTEEVEQRILDLLKEKQTE